MLEVPKADLDLPIPVMLWALAANDRQGFRLQQSPDRVDHVDTDRDVPDRMKERQALMPGDPR